MAKPVKIYLDTETSGLNEKHSQILEIAAIAVDDTGKEIDRFHRFVSLKKGLTPSPMAVAVNGINPYSEEYKKSAVTEHKMASDLAEFASKHSKDGVKPQFVAYNAQFDKKHVALALSRAGHKFSDVFNKSIKDPLKTAKLLTSSGALKTREKTDKRGSKYNSSTLGDVASAIGVGVADSDLHTAMGDVKTLSQIDPLIDSRVGAVMGISVASPQFNEGVEPGECIHVVTNSAGSGFKERHLLVLNNSEQDRKIIALDSNDIDLYGRYGDTSVRTFNYDTIVGELPVDSGKEKRLRDIADHEIDSISMSVSKLKDGQPIEPEFAPEVSDYEILSGVEERLSDKGASKSEIELVKGYLKYTLKLSDKDVAAILTKAEQIALSKGKPGWNEATHGHLRGPSDVSMEIDGKLVTVKFMPNGHYSMIFDGSRRSFRLRSEMEKHLGEQGLTKDKLRVFFKSLPEGDKFMQPDHPLVLMEEIGKIRQKIAAGEMTVSKSGLAALDGIEATVFPRRKKEGVGGDSGGAPAGQGGSESTSDTKQTSAQSASKEGKHGLKECGVYRCHGDKCTPPKAA